MSFRLTIDHWTLRNAQFICSILTRIFKSLPLVNIDYILESYSFSVNQWYLNLICTFCVFWQHSSQQPLHLFTTTDLDQSGCHLIWFCFTVKILVLNLYNGAINTCFLVKGSKTSKPITSFNNRWFPLWNQKNIRIVLAFVLTMGIVIFVFYANL